MIKGYKNFTVKEIQWPLNKKIFLASFIWEKWKVNYTEMLFFYSHALVKSQKSENTLRWPTSRERGILVHCWWEWKMVQTLWRASWHYHSKLQIHFLSTQKSFFREKFVTAISERDYIDGCSIILMAKD